MTFKLYYSRKGAHVHVSMFAGTDQDHLAHTGNLTLRENEWAEFRRVLILGEYGTLRGQLSPHDDEPGDAVQVILTEGKP